MAVFPRAMDTLIALRGPDVLRVKGFLNLEGCKGPVLVQFVQHLIHPPVELAQWPDADRPSRLVFITRDVPGEAGARSVRRLQGARLQRPREQRSLYVAASRITSAMRRLVARRHDVHAGNAGDRRQLLASGRRRCAGPRRPDRPRFPAAR